MAMKSTVSLSFQSRETTTLIVSALTPENERVGRIINPRSLRKASGYAFWLTRPESLIANILPQRDFFGFGAALPGGA